MWGGGGIVSLILKSWNRQITHLTVVWYGFETWCLKLTDETNWRCFENRVTGKIFGPLRERVKGGWGKSHAKELQVCSPQQILLGWSTLEEWDGRGIWHVWGREEVNTGFWWGNLRGKPHLDDLDLHWKIVLNFILRKSDGRAWSGLIWLRIETRDGPLWTS